MQRSFVLASVLLLLAGCGGAGNEAAKGGGLVPGLGKESASARAADDTGLAVNAYLWRASLDVLSFMPLVSADPFGGVIITDWFQPPAAPNERFKATAYILGRQLRADAIRIAVFRQTLENGRWTDDAVSPSTVGEMEDKVLARARELRARAGAQG